MKKLISVILLTAITAALACVAPRADAVVKYVHGDVDNSGDLTILDATLIQRWDLDIPLYSFDELAADYNSDDEIDITDTTLIQRRLCLIPICSVYSYSQMNAYTAAYMEGEDYLDDDHSYSLMPAYVPYNRSETSRPASYFLDIPESGTLYLWDEGNCSTYRVSAGPFEVCNMTPSNEVTYLLVDDRGERVKAGLLYPEGQVRMINAGGRTFNIRDLGGWACDGGKLKYGLVYRGCELSGEKYHVDIDELQKSFFRDYLGICDEIDMRGDAEVSGKDGIYGTTDDITESVLGDSVSYVRYTAAPYSVGINLDNEYQTLYYAAMIKRVAYDVNNDRPCYLHCLAGADRTGTLCALIEALCGVSLSDIERDYELTSLSPESARLRSGREWNGLLNYINKLPGKSFRDKVVYYSVKAGVSVSDIDTLRAGLIDGTPELIAYP